jgi:hypothetical protein
MVLDRGDFNRSFNSGLPFFLVRLYSPPYEVRFGPFFNVIESAEHGIGDRLPRQFAVYFSSSDFPRFFPASCLKRMLVPRIVPTLLALPRTMSLVLKVVLSPLV